MNICFVTMGGLLGQASAAPKLITGKARALSRLGHRVTVITDDPSAYYEVREGEFEPRPFPRWSSLLHRTIRRRADRWLASRGIPEAERPQFLCARDPGLALRVLYFVLTRPVDVLHAEKLGYAYPCLPARALCRVFLCIVQHDIETQRLADTCDLPAEAVRFIERFERAACARTDAVVAVSTQDRDRLAAIGVDRGRVAVIPHGLDADRFRRADGAAVRRRHRLGGGPVLVYHGTCSYRPNSEAIAELATDILPRVRREGADARLLVVGPDPPAHSPSPHIVFAGGVAADEELADHLAAGDVAVLPIRSGGGTRVKILEYFAAGVPVVSTAKGAEGIPVEDGTHLLFAEEAADMAARALSLLRDAELRARLVAAGRAFAAAHDWSRIAARFVELYRRRRAG
ncbi:MAG: glycosyltransferase family 4 protein [bacterium]|nr:glycosyltransferase family 4 protein [bacterium]